MIFISGVLAAGYKYIVGFRPFGTHQNEEITAIYIDGRKSHTYEARLKKTLRDIGIKTNKLKTVNDKAFPGVQIADSIAGLYRHELDKPSAQSAQLQSVIGSKQI